MYFKEVPKFEYLCKIAKKKKKKFMMIPSRIVFKSFKYILNTFKPVYNTAALVRAYKRST